MNVVVYKPCVVHVLSINSVVVASYTYTTNIILIYCQVSCDELVIKSYCQTMNSPVLSEERRVSAPLVNSTDSTLSL